jgi:heptose-I-phosphate ethanolaminephosphotransferase
MNIANTPLKKSLLFVSIVLFYLLLGYLNYTRAFKIAFMGFFFIFLLEVLKSYFYTKPFKILFYSILSILFLNLGFHAVLRDMFGVAQEDILVIQSIFNTDIQESKEFIFQYKWYLLKHLTILLSSFFLYIHYVINKKNKKFNRKKLLIIGLFFFILIHLNPSMRRSDPFVYFFYYYHKYQQSIEGTKALFKQVEQNLKSKKITSSYIGEEDNNTIVWVIGESDTRWNWSLYGYSRDTNHYIKTFKDNLLVVNNAQAAAPATVSAFELMMTAATKDNPDSWSKKLNIISIANLAGYKTYWISNHTSDKWGVINLFAKSATQTIFTNKGRARGEGSYDEAVLKPFNKAINEHVKKKLIIIHLMGSHPAYDYRYPKEFSKFTSTFDDRVIRNLESKGRYRAALLFRNLYDNTILYSDYIRYQILNSIQESKQQQNTTFIYHPDHGQDVCHNSNFSGHNYRVRQQWDIPMIVWGKYKKNLEYLNHEKSVELDTINNLILKLLHIKYSVNNL